MKKLLLALSIVVAMLFFVPRHNVILEGYDINAAVKVDATLRVHCPDMVGTGIVIGPHAVLTASHVVDHGYVCRVNLHGRWFDATVKQDDEADDFAVLETKHTFTTIYAVDCTPFQPNQSYTLVGYVHGEDFHVFPEIALDYFTMIARDGSHNILREFNGRSVEGMSGGPIVNQKGEVQGYLVGRVKVDGHAAIKELASTSVCKR